MANLNNAAACLKAFYRLVGTVSGDQGLRENGESADEVAYLSLNHGVEAAQRFMIANGMTERWLIRSSALSWSGSDATGGRWSALPADFLRFGKTDRADSSLMEEDGRRWGAEVTADQNQILGNHYYLRNDRLWLTKGASPPTLYLEYMYRHPEFTSSVTLDFPIEARALIIALAANHAMSEGWFPGLNESRIARNVEFWRGQARTVARRSRQPRKMTPPKVTGSRYFA
jgi:hypothetical protein